MGDPKRFHAEALADVDNLIAYLRGRLSGSWTSSAGFDDPMLALQSAEGRKRILQRHAPGPDPTRCRRCFLPGAVREEPWPCPDWRDAAGQETPDA